jgi:hypothetical protein
MLHAKRLSYSRPRSMLRVGRSTEADAQIPLELSHPFAGIRLGLAGRARRGGNLTGSCWACGRLFPACRPQGVYLVNCRILSASGFHVDTRPSAVCLCLDVRKT